MKIKQKLLDEGFVVEVNVKNSELDKLMLYLEENTDWHWSGMDKPTNYNIIKAYGEEFEEFVSICFHEPYKPNQLEFSDREFYEGNGFKVLNYEDIWEEEIEFKDSNFYITCALTGVGLSRNKTYYSTEALKNAVNKANQRGIADELFIDNSFFDNYNCTWGNIEEEEEEMSKIQSKIEQLESKLDNLYYMRDRLEDALELHKHSLTLQDKLRKTKYEIGKFAKLLKGYQALDNMYISEVFKHGKYVVVKTIYGDIASSAPDEKDEFNFCTGFAFCNIKLSLDNDWYVHEINLALKDIEKGNL